MIEEFRTEERSTRTFASGFRLRDRRGGLFNRDPFEGGDGKARGRFRTFRYLRPISTMTPSPSRGGTLPKTTGFPPNGSRAGSPSRTTSFARSGKSGRCASSPRIAWSRTHRSPGWICISCRNLLIYMDADLQDRVLRIFHYALRPDGVLFLGPSEGVSAMNFPRS